MAKKRVIKIHSLASITCQKCGKKSKRKVPLDASPQFFDCDKCHERTLTPITQCCVICAFTNTKCAPTLTREARVKGLELRIPDQKE